MALPLRDDAPTQHVPWVTIALMVINVVVFLWLQPIGYQGGGTTEYGLRPEVQREAEEFAYRWGSVPCELVTGEQVVDRPAGCDRPSTSNLPADKSIPASLLASMFLHGNVLHLGGNMLFLWVFGNNVEDRLGRWRYLGLYLLGGLAASLGFALANRHLADPAIGASGAIAAAMGAYLVLCPRQRVLTVIATAAFQVVYVPAVVVLALFFVTQFFTGAEEGVAWEAHVAGMVAGALLAAALSQLPSVKARADRPAESRTMRAGQTF